MMHRILAATAAVLVFAGPSVAQEAFTSAKGRYSISMPQKPKEITQDAETPFGKLKVFIAVCEVANNSGAFVGYCDYPAKVLESPAQTILARVRSGFAGADGKLISDKEVTLAEAKVPGRDAVIMKNNIFWRYRIYLDGARVYQIAAARPTQEEATSKETDQFVNSFQIIGTLFDNKAGTFRISFPKKPQEFTKDQPIGKDNIKIYFTLLQLDAAHALMVCYNDLPAAQAKPDVQGFLGQVRDGSMGKDGKLVKDEEISLGEAKIPGREYFFEKGTVVFRCRSYFIGNRIYQLMATGPNMGDVTNDACDAFFESFAITAARETPK